MPAGGAPAPKEKQPMDEHQVDVLFLSRQEVESLLTYADVVRAVEDAFRADGSNRMLVPSKEVMRVGPDRANCIFAMPGCLESLNASGVKWTNFYPAQPDGYPTIWAHVLVLSRMDNGMPYAILDATAITNMRTAGGHAVVAAKHLARKGAKTLGVLGCGAQGRCAVRSFDEHFDLERIIVCSATPAKLEQYVRETEGTLRARLEIAQSPRDLAERSDILLTATTCRTPLIRAEWLPEGCLVDAMFAFNDIEPHISRFCDKWVVGHRESDRIEILEHPSFGHLLDPSDVYASLGEIVCGRVPGRENDRERIVFSHMGMGTLDITVGVHLVEKARRLGVGRTLRLT